MTNELFLAILSMDAYNRGYGHGLDVVAAGASATNIGNATIGLNSTELSAGIPGGQAASFFAQSYTWGNQKVIAYRGTDANPDISSLQSFVTSLPQSGVWNGYGTATGDCDDTAMQELRQVS